MITEAYPLFLASKSLKRNLDNFLTNADKGNNVIRLHKSDYILTAHSLLHDNSDHEKMRSSPYPTVTKLFRRNLRGITAKCPDPQKSDRFRLGILLIIRDRHYFSTISCQLTSVNVY